MIVSQKTCMEMCVLVWLFELKNKHHCYLKGRPTHKLCLFRFRCLAETFSWKWTMWACYVEKRKWQVYCQEIKKKKTEFWKMSNCSHELQGSQEVKNCLITSEVILRKVKFSYFICIMKCANIWEISIIQWTYTFQK